MNSNLNVFILFWAMIISFGCGAKKQTPEPTTVQSNFISLNEVQIASGASDYVGNWSGYIESEYTLITINSDGSVLLNSNGQTVQEELVKNDQDEFFITDTKSDQLLPVELYDANLSLYGQDNNEYSFSIHPSSNNPVLN